MDLFRILLSTLISIQMVAYFFFGILEGETVESKMGWSTVVITYALCLIGLWNG